jgi:hypothetical protein
VIFNISFPYAIGYYKLLAWESLQLLFMSFTLPNSEGNSEFITSEGIEMKKLMSVCVALALSPIANADNIKVSCSAELYSAHPGDEGVQQFKDDGTSTSSLTRLSTDDALSVFKVIKFKDESDVVSDKLELTVSIKPHSSKWVEGADTTVVYAVWKKRVVKGNRVLWKVVNRSVDDSNLVQNDTMLQWVKEGTPNIVVYMDNWKVWKKAYKSENPEVKQLLINAEVDQAMEKAAEVGDISKDDTYRLRYFCITNY